MKRTLFCNAELICPNGQRRGGLLVENGTISAVLSPDLPAEGDFERVDLHGAYLAPGFIDIHVHGGGGGDFEQHQAAFGQYRHCRAHVDPDLPHGLSYGPRNGIARTVLCGGGDR